MTVVRRANEKNPYGRESLARLSLSLFLLLVLSACASNATREPAPAEVEERVVVDGDALPLPEDRDIQAQPLPGAPAESPVVRRLMASASTAMDNGDTTSAVNSLERALRIEPRNAVLWNRLAKVRFRQENWQQAIQLASRSNTLTGDNPGLRRDNWNLIANAHAALGNTEAAAEFRRKLRQP